ncbi:MAG TPA: matrixin family metalloprotease, partial [Planctomycetaceae bacterium]|nr:matrixin family metalloprotease [Planctomycetaceae bacterium]
PCAMYAPGYRPKSATEDYLPKSTGGNDLSANFVVRDPNWKWPQPGGKWTTLTVTYSYSNLLDGGMRGITAAQLRSGVVEALRIWSAVSPLTFREVTDSGPTPSDSSYAPGSSPHLRFGHHAIDGVSNVLAHAFYPFDVTGDGLSGDLHFDEGETWVVRPSGARIDFIEVAVHEIGHSLGLAHSATTQAIMFPFYGGRFSGPGTAFILPDDRDGIQAIYGPKPTTTPNVPEPPIPPPTPTPNANVITVAYNTTNKTLTLTGDGSANSMTLTRTGTNLIATAGTGTTLVHLGLKKSSVIFPNVSGKIQVTGSLGSGSDSFTGTSLDVDSFQLDLSGGNDSVVLNLSSITTLNLNGGSGTDTFVGSTSRITKNLSTGFP